MERPVISRLNSGASSNGDVFEPSSSNAKQRASLVGWLNSVLPDLNLPINASDEELRALLVDSTALCRVLNQLKPGSVVEDGISVSSSPSPVENVQRFLSGIDQMGLPRFQASDLEKGPMKIVLDCLLTLQTHFMHNGIVRSNGRDSNLRSKVFEPVNYGSPSRKEEPFRMLSSPSFGEDRRSQRGIRTPVTPDPSTAVPNISGHKFHEVYQLKQGPFTDIPAAKITEMMKSNSLDNAPTQTLLSLVNGILDESIERKNGEIPDRVGCLLRKVVQEIERRVATQAEHLRTQNNLFKAREEKYKSRIRVLEALATGTSEETQIVMNQLQQFKSEKDKIEEKKKSDDHNQEISSLKKELGEVRKMMKENNDHNKEMAALKQELEIAQRRIKENEISNQEVAALKQELETAQRRMKDNESNNQEVTALKQELETAQRRMKENEANNQEVTALKQELETAQRRMKENGNHNQEVEALKEELETARRRIKESDGHLKQEVEALKEELQTARRRMKENDVHLNQEVEDLKEELETARRRMKENDEQIKQEKNEHMKELAALKQENDEHIRELAALKQEIEVNKKLYELQSSQSQEAKGAQQELEKRLKEVEKELNESRKRANELEALSAKKSEWWNKKENLYHIFTEFQLGALRELRFASQSIKQEVVKTEKSYAKEFVTLGSRIKDLDDAAKSYYSLLNENRKLHNELQELKGNIRVYCRVRPFLPGQKGKQSCVEYVGENGELIVMNPAKQGKEARRSFKFNKVYGPTTTQGQVYTDTQPLVQSVLDGYNVCIFAYGQTGSGKTYTMTGPTKGTEEEWGVNYRALNDLFRISQSRASTFKYEVSVQMVEIYNEQIRDLLATDAAQRKVGVLSTSQPNGLAVPDANILPVNSTSDVLKVMDVGQKNRAQASTSMNERSSRSHSIVSIHAKGTDLKSGSTLRASLHLVDLAGSERIDRSEVTGDRLKEAQHINKSLSALGDVIFALAQKNSHVPYRNSKLTQVLQSSLGGQAKTLMFVQLNPDGDSFSESLSTLKFAERVSGVELGAAKSSKDGRDVRELMEQVATLKDTIAKKDEEIERLNDKRGSLRYGSTFSQNDTIPRPILDLSGRNFSESTDSDHDDCSKGRT